MQENSIRLPSEQHICQSILEFYDYLRIRIRFAFWMPELTKRIRIMIVYAIAVISLIALLVDYYIYRRIIRKHRFGKWMRVGYIVYALAVDLIIVSALIFYRNSLDRESPQLLHAVSWVFFLFFLNALPKLTYVLVSLPDLLVRRITHRTSRLFGYAGTALGLYVFTAMLWGGSVGRSRIEVRRVDITSPRIPAAFDGFRIVQFSDTHIGMLIHSDRILSRMVDTINALHPDIVVNSGDLVNSHVTELTPEIVSVLSGVRAPVYSVLGNHDLGVYIHDTLKLSPEENVRRLLTLQRQMGWIPLVNESRFLTRGTDRITISGVNFPANYKLNGHASSMCGVDLERTFDGVPDSLYNITVSHAPQLWDNLLVAGKSDLTLAGHVHSMQMKFRLGKWAWSPARWMYVRWSGLYEEGNRQLYINDGIGYVLYPMRIGTYPEVTLIVLHHGTDTRAKTIRP